MIRLYNKEDIEYLVDLEQRILHTTLGYDRMLADLDNAFTFYFVYEENHKIIGYISTIFDGYSLEILNFCMEESVQRKGKGSYLLAYVLDFFYQKKVISAVLEVRKDNGIAIHIYEKFGFQMIRIRKNYYSDGTDAYMMQKTFVPFDDIEDAYLQMFAEFEYCDSYTKVYDISQPDNYQHNFYRLHQMDIHVIDNLVRNAKDFVQIRWQSFVDLPNFSVDDMVYMHSNIYKLKVKKEKGYFVRRLDDKDKREIYDFMYSYEILNGGMEYSEKNAQRYMDLNEKNKIILYGIWQKNELVGILYSYIYKNSAKIGEVHKQGYEFCFMDLVIEDLKQLQVQDIFLCVNHKDRLYDMYCDMGMNIVGEEFVYTWVRK